MTTLQVFRYVAWLTGAGLAVSFGLLGLGIGALAAPKNPGMSVAFVCLGMLSQSGLIIAPWSLSHGSGARVIASALMSPTAAFLGFGACGGLIRLAAGHPVGSIGLLVYVAGAGVYVFAYVMLIRSRSP